MLKHKTLSLSKTIQRKDWAAFVKTPECDTPGRQRIQAYTRARTYIYAYMYMHTDTHTITRVYTHTCACVYAHRLVQFK